MKLLKDIQIQPNLTFNEFLDQSNTVLPNTEQTLNIYHLSDYLQALRNIVGSITINSAFRDIKHNKAVNGSANSYHLTGLAADIKFDFKGWTRSALTKILQDIGFTNVNFYFTQDRKTFVWIHVDIGKTWNGKEFNYRDLDSITQKEIIV
jgi:uncharacterized protein YcbK (DUF882 family)